MIKQKIIIASGNTGKIRELQAILNTLAIDTVPQAEFGVEDADETGLTFIENALIKARHATTHTGLPAIADDSGLCITALDNRPGIYSARYAGPNATTHDRITKVLGELQGVEDNHRHAAFHSVIVYLRHSTDPNPLIAHGVWHGRITQQPMGEHGFGYDPIFYVPEYACTVAELSDDIKNKISHRAQALQQLCQQLTNTLKLESTL